MSGDSTPRAFCVFIEPAPYITRLGEELSGRWPAPVETWFITRTLTQAWERSLEQSGGRVLPKGTLAAAATLWRELRRKRPGVVFVAGWSHPVIIAVIIMSRLLGAKVISMSDTHISTSRGLRAAAKRTVMRLIDRFTPAGSRQSQYLRDQGILPDRIFVARMTVDVSAATAFLSQQRLRRRREVREALGAAEDAPVFLYVGRLEPVKGPDLLLAAFNREEVSKSARLIVVGDGTMRGKIEAAARADPRIVSRGRLEGPALWAQFASADVLVVPSRSESWGLVVNEALVAGLTVIVADCAGCIGDLIQDEVNGLIFPTHSVEALGSALARLSHDPALRTFLKGNAAATIADWTTEAWAGNILAAWRDSLSDRQPGLQDAT